MRSTALNQVAQSKAISAVPHDDEVMSNAPMFFGMQNKRGNLVRGPKAVVINRYGTRPIHHAASRQCQEDLWHRSSKYSRGVLQDHEC